MLKFISAPYLFNMRPDSLHYTGMLVFAVIIAIFVLIMVLFSIFKKRKNNIYFKIWKRLNSFAWTNIILALLLLFFEYEEIYIFSARFWLLIWGVSMIVWLLFIYKEALKIPKIRMAYEKEREYKKYIP